MTYLSRAALVFTLSFAARPVFAQLNVTLRPRTVEAFDRYAKKVEQQLERRWSGTQPFLSISQSPDELDQVMQGAVDVRPGAPDNPVGTPYGLVHDWVGTVFIPDATLQQVLGILQDFKRHAQIYPDIIESHLISVQGNEFTGEWRLRRKGPLGALVLAVRQHEFYRELGPGKWICRAYANDISEVENAGEPGEKILPPGQGLGFLWRLHGYWSLEAVKGGVLAECRTLSLSRDVPLGVAWMVKPFLQSVPHDSLAATLRQTRAAATK